MMKITTVVFSNVVSIAGRVLRKAGMFCVLWELEVMLHSSHGSVYAKICGI